MAYKFEDLLHPSDDREGDTSDATLEYEQEDSNLTLDYEQEEKDSLKVEEKMKSEEGNLKTVKQKIEEVATLHSEDKTELGTKKRKLGEGVESPPSAKRTLSLAKKELTVAVVDVMKTDSEKERNLCEERKSVDEGKSVGEGVPSKSVGTVKPNLEKKDSMEENLICQICQVSYYFDLCFS